MAIAATSCALYGVAGQGRQFRQMVTETADVRRSIERMIFNPRVKKLFPQKGAEKERVLEGRFLL